MEKIETSTIASLRRVKMDTRRQSRRAWALSRFPLDNVDAIAARMKKEGKKDEAERYLARRNAEFAALQSRVGNISPRTFDENDSPARP